MSELGLRIKEQRKRLGLTQEDISGPSLSHAVVSLIERGKTNPSLKTLEQIAGKLGVDVNYLLYGEEAGNASSFNERGTIVMIQRLLTLEKYGEAERIFQELEGKDLSIEYRGKYAKLHSEVFIGQGEYEKALDQLEIAILYLTPYDFDDYVETYNHLSTCHRLMENYEISIKNGLNGLLLLDSNFSHSNPSLKLMLYYNVSYSFCRVNDFKQGLHYIERAFNYMKESNLSYYEKEFYMLKGLVHLHLNEYELGIETTSKALAFMDGAEDITKTIGCYSNLGLLYRESGNFELSIEYLKKSLEMSLGHNKDWDQLNNYYELALTYTIYEEYQAAEQICREQVLKTEEASPLRIKIILLLAYLKMELGSFAEALTYVNNAESDAVQIDDSYLMAKAFILKSKIYTKQGFHMEANELLARAIAMYDRLNEPSYNTIKFI
jgi:HTH-type transcriptional regulator, quorum sensing regulator NprR